MSSTVPQPTPALKHVLVFTHPQAPAPADLERIFPLTHLTLVTPTQAAELLVSPTSAPVDWPRAIAWLRHQQFDAAVILTAPGQSPYTLGYLCYLAGIPIRIGQSHEFGGQVLSHCSPPPEDGDCRHLLDLLGEWWSGWVDKSQPKAL